jgi:hypothetical protein
MNNFAHDIAVITRSLDLKDRRIAELETMLAVRYAAGRGFRTPHGCRQKRRRP